MGRPSKNPNHPLVRLRKQLSSKIRADTGDLVPMTHQMTRGELAQKTGVPEPTLKDIELGKFKLTSDVAMKVAFATGVSLQSLTSGDDPLLDLVGNSLTASSPKTDNLVLMPFYEQTLQHICLAVWEAAKEKKIGLLLSYNFENWLATTIDALGLRDGLTEKLTDRMDFIDPMDTPAFAFQPKGPRHAFKPGSAKYLEQVRKWRGRSEEIDREQMRLYEALNSDWKTATYDPVKERTQMLECRQKAIDNLSKPEKQSNSKVRKSA